MTKQQNDTVFYLYFFIVILAINSGLMYRVFNPHFKTIVQDFSSFWVIPYIVTIIIIAKKKIDVTRDSIHYTSMLLMMISFLLMLFLKPSILSYFLINTLLLTSFGIFDLFWWIMLTKLTQQNTITIFSTGLACNVFGVIIGNGISSLNEAQLILQSHITAIALTILCTAMVILVYLNKKMTLLSSLPITTVTIPLGYDLLTQRELDVIDAIISGKSNKEVAITLFISENTTKTHLKNIYHKLNVNSRMQLVSLVQEYHKSVRSNH